MLEENNNFDINQTENEEQVEQSFNKVDTSYNDELYQKFIKEKETKKGIRRTALIIGIPAIFLSFVGYIWSFLYSFFTLKVAGLTVEQAVKLANNPAIEQILHIILSCFMFLLPFTLSAKFGRVKLASLIQFNKPKKGMFLPFILFGMGFCSFANIAMSYASQYFRGFGVEYEVDFGENPSGIFGFLLTFIATAIVPALVEEFACRGIVLGLLKKYGSGFAIITSSLIFGIMHGNFEQIPFALMVGLILGYVYVKTNSLWPGIVIHGINNAISVIFNYLGDLIGSDAQNILYIAYLSFSMLMIIVGVWLFAKNTDDDYELQKSDDTIAQKDKYIWFFTSWAIIVFVILNLYEAMSYFVV